MGDPRKLRKKFRGPSHPWNKQRIEEEAVLRKDYGTKNKKEIYRLNSLLSKFKSEAKRLIALHTDQAELEKKRLLDKLQNFKLIGQGAKLDDVLAISINDLMERRIQTLLVRRGLARSVKQARQFITHKHVLCSGKLMTSPSNLLTGEQESTLSFVPSSSLANPSHPEREIKQKEEGESSNKKKAPKPKGSEAPKKDRKPRKKFKEEKR